MTRSEDRDPDRTDASLFETTVRGRRQQILAVLSRVRTRLDEITDRMVEHYRAEVPGYAELSPEIIERDVRPVSKRSLEIFFGSVEGSRSPLEEELAVMREGAVRRAEQGLPLSDLLHAYRAGTRIAWTAVLEELDAGTREEREAGAEIAATLLDYLDHVSTAVEAAYLAEWRTQIHQTALHRWHLANELLAEPKATRVRLLAREAGVTLPDEVVVASLPAGARVDADVEKGIPGFMSEVHGRSVFFLDPAIAPQDLAALGARARAVVGVAERRSWPEGLGPAFADASATADLAERLGMSGIVPAERLLAERLLSAEPEVSRSLFEATFHDLIASDTSGALLATVEAYLEAGASLVGAAERLDVHPNTVSYRLDRARRVGGIDLDAADDRFRVHLALRARRLITPAEVPVPRGDAAPGRPARRAGRAPRDP